VAQSIWDTTRVVCFGMLIEERIGYRMSYLDRFELHYYLTGGSHQIDAILRNKCEAEIIAIVSEVSHALGFDAKIVAEAVREGGFREFWKLIQDNAVAVTLILTVVQTLIATAPLVLESEKEGLEKQLIRLQIEEAKNNLDGLKRDAKENGQAPKTINAAVNKLSKNLKIIKRKSNFYELLAQDQGVQKVGFNLSSSSADIHSEEKIVSRENFFDFILSSNKLKSEEVEATIEIVSPVLKEGRYKWKGIFNDQPISFQMLDVDFKDSVILDNVAFQHGTYIVCVLRISRELDEVGEIRTTGYAVTTVIEKIDTLSRNETLQGQKYRHAKKMSDGQGNLFS
jgi:hypothetical protein